MKCSVHMTAAPLHQPINVNRKILGPIPLPPSVAAALFRLLWHAFKGLDLETFVAAGVVPYNWKDFSNEGEKGLQQSLFSL